LSQIERIPLTREEIETAKLAQVITRSLMSMEVEAKIAQLLMIQLRYTPDVIFLCYVGPREYELLFRLRPGGIILFGENLQSPAQTIEFIEEIQRIQGGPPPILATDQEGGVVNRLRSPLLHSTLTPASSVLGTLESEASKAVGQVLGAELRALGITMNLAPVADLATPGGQSFIRTRSFGADPGAAGERVAAMIEGLGSSRVASIMKHYPGHGDTAQDSHLELITFPTNLEQLMERDLLPFRQGIEAGAAGTMAAHISYPNIDPSGYPASISEIMLTEILREGLGYDGLIMTDALEMQGLRQFMAPDEAAVQAILAGADIILTPYNPWPTYEALYRAVKDGILPISRLDQSVRRILEHKARWGSGQDPLLNTDQKIRLAEKILGSPEHQSLIATWWTP